MDSKTDILFARYFSGEATEEDLRELDNYLLESAENEACFFEMTTLYERTAMISSMPQPDAKKAILNFKKHIREKKTIPLSRKHRFFFTRYIAVAAAIAILVVFIFRSATNEKNSTVAINAIAENAQTVTIADRVRVKLDYGAELSYQKQSPNKPELRGKATFTVTKKTDQQLIVKAGNTYIKDIGTVFSVDATSPLESVTVSVSQGEVIFYTQNNHGIKLEKGEIGIYYTKNDIFQYLTKRTDADLIFKNETLASIIPQLESKYGVIIHLESENLKDLQINASFASSESVDEILKIMTETLSLHLEKNNKNEYIISVK